MAREKIKIVYNEDFNLDRFKEGVANRENNWKANLQHLLHLKHLFRQHWFLKNNWKANLQHLLPEDPPLFQRRFSKSLGKNIRYYGKIGNNSGSKFRHEFYRPPWRLKVFDHQQASSCVLHAHTCSKTFSRHYGRSPYNQSLRLQNNKSQASRPHSWVVF